MTRFEDSTTGDFFGMKYSPNNYGLNDFNTPTIEYIANDISQIMGFDPMSMRIIRNVDGSESLVTELAQNIYGGNNVFDAFEAEEVGLAARVPVQERLRMNVLDAIIDNVDRNEGNYLFGVNPNGSVHLIPIDHGFSLKDGNSLADVWKENRSYAFESPRNISTYDAYKTNPAKLKKNLVDEVVKLQEMWRGQNLKQLKDKFADLIGQQKNLGNERVTHNDVIRGVNKALARVIEFITLDPDTFVDYIMEQISLSLRADDIMRDF
jgi:hypothetical protein